MRSILKALAVLPFLGGAVAAQGYPEKPITLVVGFSAGGGMDTLARMVAEPAGAALGQQIAVENRPGAGGTIAPGYVANARADGYTIWLGETAATIGPVVHGDVGYDPVESFVPIAQLAVAPLALVAGADVEASSIQDFVDLVKANPGEYFYAAPGVATLQHLAVEALADAADLEIDAVQFQGGSPSMQAVVSGEVPFAIVSLNAARSQSEGGNVTILGVTTAEPVPGFEDIGPISEVVEGFDAAPRMFVMAPAGIPADAVAALRDGFRTAMENTELRADLAARGLVPTYLDGPQLAEELPGVIETWGETARSVLQD
jgi:tripartite-type tricarboxylate transporter receptor subunit TctC